MGRRGHGEGSITQRKDGRYQAAITLENHKRKYFYGKTRKEVQDKLNRALYEQKQGTIVTGSQRTLKAHLEQWVEQVCKLTKRPNTYRDVSFSDKVSFDTGSWSYQASKAYDRAFTGVLCREAGNA